MDFMIVPSGGISGLELGSSKDAVRQFFSSQPKVFQRSPDSEPADYWSAEGVFAYYTPEGRLEALEFASPASPTLRGTALTNLSMAEAKSLLQSLDPDVTVTEGGTTVRSSRMGISIWSSAAHEPDACVEAVLLHGPGYCEDNS